LVKIIATMHKAGWPAIISRVAGVALLLAGVLLAAGLCTASPHGNSVPSIFDPRSTPAESIHHLSHFVLGVTGVIFLVVFSLLSYAVVKFRSGVADVEREPAQVYGSTQIELAWTIIPILIVVVLFLATARVIHAIQDAPKPPEAVAVTAIGHRFWWEFRYPGLGIVTANELHVPVSDPSHPTPTFLRLLSADTDHSFWGPQLAGKTDLIPNRANETWLEPHETGLFLGQCAQYCGTQHAKLLLRARFPERGMEVPRPRRLARPSVLLDYWALAKPEINFLIAATTAAVPALRGQSGIVYFVVALVLGAVFLYYSARFAIQRSVACAWQLLFASIVYLPVLFALLASDKK
jgi:cytochrome c oxidase subunit II